MCNNEVKGMQMRCFCYCLYLFQRKKIHTENKKQSIFLDAKKHLTKRRKILFNIHIYSLIDSFRKQYQTPTICWPGAMRSGHDGQQERQHLEVLGYQKIEQQAKEESRVFACFILFSFFFLLLECFLFPSGFLVMTYPGCIYQVIKLLLDTSLQFSIVY